MESGLNIVNLTPHEIKIVGRDGDVVKTLPKPDTETQLPRVAVNHIEVSDDAHGVVFYQSELGAVEGLPEREAGVLYVVSTMVRTAAPDRKDLASPGSLVRDEQGQPVGCQGLTIN